MNNNKIEAPIINSYFMSFSLIELEGTKNVIEIMKRIWHEGTYLVTFVLNSKILEIKQKEILTEMIKQNKLEMRIGEACEILEWVCEILKDNPKNKC